MKKLKEAREIHSFKNVWTSDREILFKDGSGNINFFMINANPGGNGQGLHYGKRNQKGRKKLTFLKIFMGWVSCFYFCNE